MGFFSKLKASFSSASLMVEANKLFAQERYQEVVALLEQALATDPTRTEAWTNLGAAYERLGRYQDALQAHLKCIEACPNDHLAWINLGVTYDRLGKPDDEIRCYRKAVEINPSFWGGHMKLGLAQDKAGDHVSAAKSYKRATELEPRNKHLWALLSEQYDKLGQDDLSHKAMAQYRQVASDS